MKTGIHGKMPFALAAALVFFQWLCPVPVGAQSKPSESTSKIKKVLLRGQNGAWVSPNGIVAVQGAFSHLAAAKGFELVQLDNDSIITREYLKQFQVIVWNNYNNGGTAVTNQTARSAILEYIYQGGGWILIGNAIDHADTWLGLAEVLGTRIALHGDQGPAEVVFDSAAKAHKELKWMVKDFPDAFRLDDFWLSFRNTVRPLPGVTVIATARSLPETSPVLAPMGDNSGDHTFIWARQIGQGRLVYNAIGFQNNQIMEQQDSIVPKLYWENLRYAAGDYQNGCTDPANPGFDPAARVHVDALCTATGLRAAPVFSELMVSRGGMRMRIDVPGGPFQARLRDLRGALVWERSVPAGIREMTMEGAIRPGVYQFEILGAKGAIRRRLMLP